MADEQFLPQQIPAADLMSVSSSSGYILEKIIIGLCIVLAFPLIHLDQEKLKQRRFVWIGVIISDIMSHYTLFQSSSLLLLQQQDEQLQVTPQEEQNNSDEMFLSVLDWDKATIGCLSITIVPHLWTFSKQNGWLVTLALVPPALVAVYLGMKKSEGAIYTDLFWKLRAFWHVFLFLVIPYLNHLSDVKPAPPKNESGNDDKLDTTTTAGAAEQDKQQRQEKTKSSKTTTKKSKTNKKKKL